MGRLLSYAIVSGIIMIGMYLVYKLMISRDKQHGFNRGMLLSIYAVSFCAWPAYNFIDSLSHVPANVEIPVHIMPQYIIVADNIAVASQPVWGTILIWIFLAGAAVVFLKTIATWISILRLVHSGEKIRKEGYTLVMTDREDMAPFSWLSYVVVSREDFASGCPAITAHELKHLRSLHWIDLLVAQAVCILEWFNPAAWLMREELMLVHEYQADMAVIDSGCDPQEYQKLLVKKAVGARFPSLANSMNHSKLKKRITMMYKSKSSAGSKLKALALVPVAALAISVASVPAVKAALTKISDSEISLGKDTKNLPETGKLTVSLPEMQMLAYADSKATREKASRAKVPQAKDSVTTAASSDEPAIFLDGKRISMHEMDALDPANIASIDIDQQKNLVFIKSNGGVTSGTTLADTGIEVISVASVPKGDKAVPFSEAAILNGNMGIYLDGKKITPEEFCGIDPANIESMVIDKENVRISITTKESSSAASDEKSTMSHGIKIGDVFINGNKATKEEILALDPSSIAGFRLDEQTHDIYITSK